MTAEPLSAPEPERFTHQLLAYDGIEELVGVTVSFLREGARAGDALLVVAAPDKLDAVREGLSPEDAAAVSFHSSWECYAQPGVALTEFQQFIGEHAAGGQQVRVVSEPPLGSLSRPYQREVCCIDAALNAVAPRSGATVVCAVDQREDQTGMLEALRPNHPEVVQARHRRANPAFTDPETVLTQALHQPLPDPAGQIQEMVPDGPAAARWFVDECLKPVVDDDRRSDFVTAVHEVTANAFTHADMDRLRLWHEDERVVCEVRDAGTGLPDPLAGYRPPTLDQTSGWGLWLARQLAGVVEIHTSPHGSAVRLHAVRGPDPPAGRSR